MADPLFGYGVQVKRGDTVTEGETSFTLIPGFFGTVNLIGGTNDKKEITTHDGADLVHLFAAGLATLKDVGGNIKFNPYDSIQKLVLADFRLKTFRDYLIVLPGGGGAMQGFRGQVLQWDPTDPMDDYLVCAVTFVVSKILRDIDS